MIPFTAYVGTPGGPHDHREAETFEGIRLEVADLRAKHPSRWPVVVFGPDADADGDSDGLTEAQREALP